MKQGSGELVLIASILFMKLEGVFHLRYNSKFYFIKYLSI